MPKATVPDKDYNTAMDQPGTDFEGLTPVARSEILWHACDRGDLDAVKSVIRAGCDVNHFHRGHTPLMMASIRGHDYVVKELILAGCRVDQRSKGCLVDWQSFITKMAAAWPTLVALAVLVFAMMILEVGMHITEVRQEIASLVCFCLHLLIITLCLRQDDDTPPRLPRKLRMKMVAKVMAGAGILTSCAVFLVVVWTGIDAVVLTLTVIVTGARELTMVTAMVMAMAVLMVVVLALAGAGPKAVAGAVAGSMVVAGSVGMAGIMVQVEPAINDVAIFQALTDSLAVAKTGTLEELQTSLVTGAIAYKRTLMKTERLVESWAVIWLWVGAVMVVWGTTMVGAVTVAVAVIRKRADAVAVANTVAKVQALALAVGGALIAGGMMSWVAGGVTVFGVWPLGVAFSLLAVMLTMHACSATGMTALHYAAWYNHTECVVHLVEAGANIRDNIRYYRTPLHIASSRLRATIQQMPSFSAKQVVVVIGNSECGKSTLIAALQDPRESKTWLQRLVNKFAQVHNITQRTAGIDTVPFSSAEHGEILFYDFAGQHDYHGPHQSFLDAILSKPDVSVTMLLLVKINDSEDAIIQQLIRWLYPVSLASAPSTPKMMVVGSFLDQAKSKEIACKKMERCLDYLQKEYSSLKVVDFCLLDCREPHSEGIKELCTYLQRTKPVYLIPAVSSGFSDWWIELFRSHSSNLSYNTHWVMAQLTKSFFGQSLQLDTFSVWLQDNAQNLPRNIPSPEEVCRDLSTAGHILYLPNKQNLFQSWLIFDLQSILNNVYGTLFSPDQTLVNQFGLLHCSILSEKFPELDWKMIQEVLISLEFCIRVDPLLLREETLSLTVENKVGGWLYFPALVSAKGQAVFLSDQHYNCEACWQLKTDQKHSVIHPNLIHSIILRTAATLVFIEKDLPPSVRLHCCNVWMNGISWASTKGVDVAVQINEGSVIQVIGQSREGPGELYQYMSDVAQCIFKTIAKRSPALKMTPYIIHPYKYSNLDESESSPASHFPVASIVGSVEAGDNYVHSQPIASGSGSQTVRLEVQIIFGGWSPSLSVAQHLKELQSSECSSTL